MSRFRTLVWPTVAAVIAFALLIGLGTWQLERLAWKESLIKAVAERTGAAPVPVPTAAEWPRLDREAIEYRHVTVEGVFDHAAEQLVYTALPDPKGPFGGQGWWVMTPLVLGDGSTLYVNRGFVPEGYKQPQTRLEGQEAGRVVLTGLMRWSEDRNSFTPADDPAKGIWFTRDPVAMAKIRGVSTVAPFFLDADSSGPGGLPQGGETRLEFPNRHLEYALTWYGLALALAGVYLVFAWRQGKIVMAASRP